MDPISTIALAILVSTSTEVGKATISVIVKDAYEAFKRLAITRHPQISLAVREQDEQSEDRLTAIKCELASTNAGGDAELATAAHSFLALIRSNAPEIATAVGVNLESFEAANVRLNRISSPGTGVILKNGKVLGDIEISNIHSGVQSSRNFEAE